MIIIIIICTMQSLATASHKSSLPVALFFVYILIFFGNCLLCIWQAMGKYRKSPDKRRPILSRRTLPSREMMRSLGSRGRTPPKTKSAKFQSYDELKNSEVPVKREMPSRLRSRYMSDHRNEAVWDWLNHEEKITDFSYFLEICS